MTSSQTPTAASIEPITLDTLIEQDSTGSLRVFLPTVGVLTMIETVGHLGADDVAPGSR